MRCVGSNIKVLKILFARFARARQQANAWRMGAAVRQTPKKYVELGRHSPPFAEPFSLDRLSQTLFGKEGEPETSFPGHQLFVRILIRKTEHLIDPVNWNQMGVLIDIPYQFQLPLVDIRVSTFG